MRQRRARDVMMFGRHTAVAPRRQSLRNSCLRFGPPDVPGVDRMRSVAMSCLSRPALPAPRADKAGPGVGGTLEAGLDRAQAI